MPADDTLLHACPYVAAKDDEYIYFITDRRTGQLRLPAQGLLTAARKRLLSAFEGDTSTVVRLTDAVRVAEVDFPSLLPGRSEICISLFGHDAKQALVGYSFPANDGSYRRFAAVLRQALDTERNLRPAPAPDPAPASAEQRLRELARLRDQGLLTEAEYTSKRQAVLDTL